MNEELGTKTPEEFDDQPRTGQVDILPREEAGELSQENLLRAVNPELAQVLDPELTDKLEKAWGLGRKLDPEVARLEAAVKVGYVDDLSKLNHLAVERFNALPAEKQEKIKRTLEKEADRKLKNSVYPRGYLPAEHKFYKMTRPHDAEDTEETYIKFENDDKEAWLDYNSLPSAEAYAEELGKSGKQPFYRERLEKEIAESKELLGRYGIER